jgi:SAM-dependent methyltransferase
MPSLSWNVSAWGGQYSWQDGGEEWSGPWGGSEAQWFGSLYPRLHRLLPAPRVLEIAPGFGRWSKFLINASSHYLGADLNQNCTDACSKRFSFAPHARFVTNDGLSLAAAQDGLYDLIFSFDSLVHAEVEVLEAYIPEILKKLSPDGMAFIHHSNLADHGSLNGLRSHGRGKTVSGSVVETLVNRNGGYVAVQETINWVETSLIDCLTLFGRRNSDIQSTIKLANPSFQEEAALIKTFQSPYSKILAQ